MPIKKSKKKNPLKKKFTPLQDKRYIVTDQCMYETAKLENYNPLDPKRAPHALTLVDVETGSIAFLESGSIIQVIKAKQ